MAGRTRIMLLFRPLVVILLDGGGGVCAARVVAIV